MTHPTALTPHLPAPRFAAMQNTPGYKRVAQIIETEILEGRIGVGEFLPIEGDIAEQLGVNRSTVREGIRALENAGLVARGGGKRLVVTVPDAATLAMATSRAMGLRRISFRELWELQMHMEPFSARLAAQRITAVNAELLAQNIRALEEVLHEDNAVIRNVIAFHGLIAKAAENRALELSVAPIGLLIFPATEHLYPRVPQARHRLLAAHQKVAEAIIARDADAAFAWMEKHMLDFRRGFEAAGLDMDAPLTLHGSLLPG